LSQVAVLLLSIIASHTGTATNSIQQTKANLYN